ncbi:ABC transporter permease [Niastella populi]|uniref:ABC transporter permease n=1 Tax=Niastella populi TaxID=550983 RepID=A0A1V9EP39_9BACT|nr:ABC transporter permease [Niastella populi]OQP47886.1 ABC transporter permease [Niastella populi]
MIRNYIKIAWRNLWKNLFFSSLNIFGLATGMAACIVIMIFVNYERSFDDFHTKNIYRLNEVQNFPGAVAPQQVALSMYPMGPEMKKEYPEILDFVRLNAMENMDLNVGDKKIVFPKILCADSNFLQLFDFKLLKGNRKSVLQKPNSIVLTEKSAKLLFGNENPIGQTVSRIERDTIIFQVTGVLADIPQTSHLQFDGVFSFSTIARPDFMNNWGDNWLVTYFELAPKTNTANLEKKFPAFLGKHMSEDNRKFYELFLQRLPDIHSNSVNITHDYHNFQKFDKRYTGIFSTIAIIVLLIACINFMNLATAKSANRAMEVGVRKSIGALRVQLGFQFIIESVLICLFALGLALLMVLLALPYVRNLSERQLEFPLFTDPALPGLLLGGTIITGIIAGLYPSLYLSSFQPARVLKGSIVSGKPKSLFRNVLVVIQFTSSVFLIIATIFAVKQLRFMQDKDPGFNREQVMMLRLNNKSYRKYNTIKESLLGLTAVASVTASQQRLGNNLHQTSVIYHGANGAKELSVSQNVVDPDFLNLYKIKLIAGRNFSNDYETDNGKAYVINETLAQELLREDKGATFESLIGRRFGFGGMDSVGSIIGISKNFNFNSLHHKIETLCLLSQKDWGFSEMSVRLKGADTKAAIERVKDVWKQVVPGEPIDYKFLDELYNELYKSDKQVSEIVGILAALAILISCLGLFGLASFSAEKRIREIGIRKVLGASVQSMVGLLSVDFVRLVVIANIIAWPIAWLALSNWLQGFAFRIEINWLIFAVAGLASLVIALLTVSLQAIKAAWANPVKSLRT